MADGDRQLAFTTGPVPTSVQVSGPDRVTPKAVNASFDGSGAAGPFLPCLIIVGRTGHEVARIPAPQVAAGASAEVSWFPRVGGRAVDGDGWKFDTDNEGGWGLVVANDTGPDGYSLQFDTGSSDAPIGFTNDGGFVVDTAGSVEIGGGSGITLNPGGSNLDVSGFRIVNGADGINPTDFATVEQVGSGGVTSLDGIAGAVTLVAGANVTITDNSPTAGDVTIAASGGGGGGGIGASELVYRYTVTGADKASIDTGVDAPSAGSNDWTSGDVLEVWIIARTDKAVVWDALAVTANNDTAGHYDRQTLEITGSSVGGGPDTGATAWHPNVHGASAGASYPGVVHMTMPGYANATFFKVGESVSVTPDQTGGNNLVDKEAWGFRSANAITRLKVAAQGVQKLKVGSELLIYKRLAV